MVHTFRFQEKYYAYDTGSGSLHECDENTALCLKGECVEVSPEELKSILSDIEGLKDAGLLYAEETKERPVKRSQMKAMCLHICHDCNMRCRYCFADEGAYHQKREMMDLHTAKAAVDMLIRESGDRKVLEIDFFGGEPFMNFAVIRDTVYYAKAEAQKRGKKFLFTTTTNALLLNDEIISF